MWKEQCEEKLKDKGIRPTAARIIVLKALSEEKTPVSLTELEAQLVTLDKSTISRSLAVLLEKHAIHAFEDGSGSVKYEICKNDGHCALSSRHVHFRCELCQQTFCLEGIKVPLVDVPPGYLVDAINYVMKGVCPACSRLFKFKQAER